MLLEATVYWLLEKQPEKNFCDHRNKVLQRGFFFHQESHLLAEEMQHEESASKSANIVSHSFAIISGITGKMQQV